MTQLETAIALLMKTFDTYAVAEGKTDTLSKAEVKTLVEKELPELLQQPKNPAEVDTLMKGLDYNGDAEVDFNEFVILVAALACGAHDRKFKK